MRKYQIQKNEKGFVVLISVVIIGAVAVLILRNTTLTGIDELSIVSLNDDSIRSNYLAEACSQEALRRLQIDYNYTSSSTTIDFDNGYCEYSIKATGSLRQMTARGVFDLSYSKITSSIIKLDNKIIVQERD